MKNNQPQFVQSLTDEYGIVTVLDNENENPEDTWLECLQYYGNKDYCDFRDDDCSDDGVLWQANDHGSPYFCTKHTFPQEQLGYKFMHKSDIDNI